MTDLATRPVIGDASYADRLRRAETAAAEYEYETVLIGVGPDLRYLTGYQAMPLERLTMLAIIRGQKPFIVVPRLELDAAQAGLKAPVDIIPWGERDDPYGLIASRVPRHALEGGIGAIAVSDTVWAVHLLRLQAYLGHGFGPASAVMSELRMVKDAAEMAMLRAAAHAADRVVAQIAAGRLVGRTEAAVSREVRDRLVAEGHDEGLFAIVASGPNSASPHHEASDRVIRAGEPIVLDIGGTLGGYCSDITRTLWVTGGDPTKGPDERFRQLFEVLHGAQAASTLAVAPGVSCSAIDAAARDPIEAAGYGEAFFHRTGHGIGLEAHEDPYIIAGNDRPLRPGMTFSVEPGIYFPGVYGARIEDIVLCGPDGPDTLNQADRELYVVDG